jgi:hypothetical protein
MYEDLLRFPIEHERLRWDAREVVRELADGPHLFVRLTLTGTRFALRALEPQVWVGMSYARFVDIAEDGLTVRAYFDETPPPGTVYFGYAQRPELAFGDFEPERVPRLDRTRLPRGVVHEAPRGHLSDVRRAEGYGDISPG